MLAPGTPTPAFDPQRLASFTEGDPELERELLDLYFRTAAAYLIQLEAAVEDGVAWRKASHALKGASLNVGAIAVGELARAAEAQAPSAATLAEISGAFAHLRAMLGTARV
jgi:HPt (histidine-containing phosphotransfer) domain-containing protein